MSTKQSSNLVTHCCSSVTRWVAHDSRTCQTHEGDTAWIYAGSKNAGYTSILCSTLPSLHNSLPKGLTWAGVVFSCIGCVRGGGGGHPLVWTHAVVAQRWAGLSGLLVRQVQRGALLGRWQWSSWSGRDVHLQPGLGFVFHNLSVVSSCHPALVQAFIIFADSGDLQFVWDVVALDFHCL